MKIAVVGTGYVALVAGACFAETGNDVICVDKDAAKVRTLRKGGMPIFEPGPEELVRSNVARNASRSPPVLVRMEKGRMEMGLADVKRERLEVKSLRRRRLLHLSLFTFHYSLGRP